MKLLDKIINQPAVTTVNVDFLDTYLQTLPKSKANTLRPLLEVEKTKLAHISMVVPANTVALTLAAIATAPGVNFIMNQQNRNSPAPETKMQALRALICLFEDAPPKASTVVEYVTPLLSDTYPCLSKQFVQRHVTPNADQARAIATQRFAQTQTLVSSFLTPICAHYLNDEIRALNTGGFFSALTKYFKAQSKNYLLTNTLATDVVIRSKLKVQKWQCTQDRKFEAYPCTEYIYYCTASYPTLKNTQKMVADHYVRIGEVVSGDHIINGYSALGIDQLTEHAVSADKLLELTADPDDEDFGVRIYIKKSLIVG